MERVHGKMGKCRRGASLFDVYGRVLKWRLVFGQLSPGHLPTDLFPGPGELLRPLLKAGTYPGVSGRRLYVPILI